MDDRVVPPPQAESMFDAAKDLGVPTFIIEYEGKHSLVLFCSCSMCTTAVNKYGTIPSIICPPWIALRFLLVSLSIVICPYLEEITTNNL